MDDSSHGSARLLTAPDDSALLLTALPAEISYRGCSPVRPVRGTARTVPASVLRLLAGSHTAAAQRTRAVKLELAECPWAPIPAWYSARRWLAAIPAAYQRHYAERVAPQMPGNPVSLEVVLTVARARAGFADVATGRNCRPTNATLARVSGLSERTVQRASKALLLLGMATEVCRGRQRTLAERYASWRVGDKARGWASVWALHECRFPVLSPHLRSGQVVQKPSVSERLTTAPRRQAVAATTATRHRNDEGARLARQWVTAEDSPAWARRYRTPQAWAAVLQRAAEHRWSPRDLNQLLRDYVGAGKWIPETPHRPIGLLGAVLAWHGNLAERPAALEEAREAEELAAIRARITDEQDALRQAQRARAEAQAARGGAGHTAAMAAAREAAARAAARRTEQVARETAATDAAVRRARGLEDR